MCCASPAGAKASGTNFQPNERIALRLQTPHATKRPYISIPPVVEVCVVPNTVLGARAARFVDTHGNSLQGSPSISDLAGGCFVGNASNGLSELDGIQIQPWFPAQAAAWAFASGLSPPLVSTPITSEASAATAETNGLDWFGSVRYLPRSSQPLIDAALRSYECGKESNCTGLGPWSSPVEALLPPLLPGIASLRLSFVTGMSENGAPQWNTTVCRACLFVGSPPMQAIGKPISRLGPGAPLAQDIAGVRTGEFGRVSNLRLYAGFGTEVQWFDVDGDGQLDAIVAQGSEYQFIGPSIEQETGVVYIFFLDWNGGEQGTGPTIRQNVEGYGGGIGYAAYRLNRIFQEAHVPDALGSPYNEALLFGVGMAIGEDCSQSGNGHRAYLYASVSNWGSNDMSIGAIWRIPIQTNRDNGLYGSLPTIGIPDLNNMGLYGGRPDVLI